MYSIYKIPYICSTIYAGFGITWGFRNSLGVLEYIPQNKEGLLWFFIFTILKFLVRLNWWMQILYLFFVFPKAFSIPRVPLGILSERCLFWPWVLWWQGFATWINYYPTMSQPLFRIFQFNAFNWSQFLMLYKALYFCLLKC